MNKLQKEDLDLPCEFGLLTPPDSDSEPTIYEDNYETQLQETPRGSPLYSPPSPISSADELVRLHIDLEIDTDALAENQIVIAKCLAQVLGLSSSDVYFAGVEQILQNEQYIGLVHCSIRTTKHEIEPLVNMIYHTVQTQQLHRAVQHVQYEQGIANNSDNVLPNIQIRELYETNRNENEQEHIELEADLEQEHVELHFELEIDEAHAFQKNQVIKKCIAAVLKIHYSRVYVDRIEAGGLYCGHIPTTKQEIEHLVQLMYHALQNKELPAKIEKYSCTNSNQKVMLDIRELYETDQYDGDYNMAQYNINDIHKRLKLNEKCGYATIKTFSMQIYDAMQVAIHAHVSELEFTLDMMKQILLYSNHEQIIAKWYNICNKLGPFAYLISNNYQPCIYMIDLIKQFERKHVYDLPLNVRLSLLICDCIQCHLMIDCKCTNLQECVILPFKKWRSYGALVDDPYNFDDKIDGMFNEGLHVYKELGFMDPDSEAGMMLKAGMILIGYCCANVDVGSGSVSAIAILNIFNNKVLIEVESGVTGALDRQIFDFDDWFMNPYYMYDHTCMCLLSANDCLADCDDYDHTLFCTVDEIRYFMFKWTDIHIVTSNDDDIYNTSNDCMNVYYDLHIREMYEHKYNPLIYGYIRSIEKRLFLKNVPVCVIDMIWQVFPFFVENE